MSKKKTATERKNPVKIGKKIYGEMPKQEAFTKAFEPYFKKNQN